jgi:hypothetical protein
VRYRIELPENDGASAVRQFIAGWVEHPAVRRLVELEGGVWPEGSLSECVAALHAFSARWDFRGGAERLDLKGGTATSNHGEIMAVAKDLGMSRADVPVDEAYDHALVLGGTALASIYRIRRLFELRAQSISVANPAVLTALREIGTAELELVRSRNDIATIAQDVVTEFDVATRAVAHFGDAEVHTARAPNANPNLAGASADVGDTLVLAAPSADPTRRANTRDNYDAYGERIGRSDSVLVVTSSIYLPYQFFVALQALGWSKPRTIEAVGFPPEWMQGVLTGSVNVLQEMRSALYGAMHTLKLLDAI